MRRLRLAEKLLAELPGHGVMLWLDENDQRVKCWPGWGRVSAELKEQIRALWREIAAVLAARLGLIRQTPAGPPADTEAPVAPRAPSDLTEADGGGSLAAALTVGAGRARAGGGDKHDPTKNASRRNARAAALSELVAGRPCTDCERTYSWYVMSLQPRSAGAAYSLTDLVKRKASDATMDEALQGADLLCRNCRVEREYQQRQEVDEAGPARAVDISPVVTEGDHCSR